MLRLRCCCATMIFFLFLLLLNNNNNNNNFKHRFKLCQRWDLTSYGDCELLHDYSWKHKIENKRKVFSWFCMFDRVAVILYSHWLLAVGCCCQCCGFYSHVNIHSHSHSHLSIILWLCVHGHRTIQDLCVSTRCWSSFEWNKLSL